MFKLPPLPYNYNALEPYIDEMTMQIHHGKHHQAYVDNLNAALEGHASILKMDVDDLIINLSKVSEEVRTKVRNNGGGHANHSMFWKLMKKGGGKLKGELAKAIDSTFGDLSSFQEKLNAAGVGRFGSGWAWLVVEGGKLTIMDTPNQDSPLMEGKTPILGVDVWEHAYYLKYQNRRADYLKAWWNVVNWDEVERLFKMAK